MTKARKMKPTSKLKKSAALRRIVAARGLQTTGFRKAMLHLAAEYVGSEEAECELQNEWCFGEQNIVPAAYGIDRDREVVTVNIYELELSAPVPNWKMRLYSEMADTHAGPSFNLHILDRYGREFIAENNILECFWSLEKSGPEFVEEWWTIVRTDKKLPKSARTRKWKAAYDALKEMGVQI